MSMEEEAKAAVGKIVRHKKKGFEYLVESSGKDMVFLRARSKGSRSTWKWVGLLWIDYEEAKAA